jgi:hypothetical protein
MKLSSLLWMIACLLLVSCSRNTAHMIVHYSGSAPPKNIYIDEGACSTPEAFENEKKQMFSVSCSALAGNRRIAVSCSDSSLPEGFLEMYFERGDSHYVVFNDVCELSASKINDENARAKGRLAVWGASRRS